MGNVLWRWIVLPMIIGTVLFFARCGLWVWKMNRAAASESSERAEDRRPIEENYREMTEEFAKAILQKDYRTAYSMCSMQLRSRLNAAKFAEVFQGWVPVQTFEIRPGDKDVSDDILCPKELRPLVKENVIVDFNGKDGDGFCAILYLIDGPGERPQLAHFLLDD